MAVNLRTLLVLGRVSNLPTVWSNCLAAWLLAGGTDWSKFAWVLASGTCLYLGGMFLNDACDAAFDRQHRSERPIARGHITRRAVTAWSAGLLLAGLLLALPLGMRALGVALGLTATIVGYDLWHKKHPLTLGLMAACRFLLYALAAVAAAGTMSPRVLVAAASVAGYVLGISLLARHESGTNRPPRWPLLLLLLPVIPPLFQATSDNWVFILAFLISYVGLLLLTLLPLWQSNASIGRTVGQLLAGLVIVDWLQLSPLGPIWAAIALFAFYQLGRLLQRRVPAT